MATTTENDIRELKELINNRFERLDAQFEQLDKKVEQLDKKMEIQFAEVKGEIKCVDERINSLAQRIDDTNKNLAQRIDDTNKNLAQRIDDTNKRLDDINGRLNITTIGFLGIVGVLVTGILAAIWQLATNRV